MFISKKCGCATKICNCCCSPTQISQIQGNLEILAVKSRLDLLFLLSFKPHCVCDLEKHTNFSQTLVSHHLSDLLRAGLVQKKRKGKFMEYSLPQKGKKTLKALTLMIGGELDGRKKR
jgi:ArsR family transcriptional regulator